MTKNFKAQSAMEYLMTYGWAILIIAIVLAALYILGVFNGSAFIGTTCTATSGALCTSPIASPSTFSVTLGQVSTTDWAATTFAFVPTGSVMPATTSMTSYPANSVLGVPSGTVNDIIPYAGGTSGDVPGASSMTSGFTTTVTFDAATDCLTSQDNNAISKCSSIPSAVGSTTSGEIWAIYTLPTTNDSSPFYAQELGKATMKIS
ncbi:hypothetical protein Mia14_0665 [Candidatus Mancarchaeum acidiphilum]|uniref:Uncharacterized protein n=1 Tax=Candidatus Mancarchaeum acidiphilum TaxID=1920749 RepID=A0A218NNB7_9ARCH|nr:hypothetical protein [Candidatus Mancarchaeum acidiphilum]ASI13968.1 hypothetical protein Mia14_0665 [Candidatus Mancarchaeum acidiphilum]